MVELENTRLPQEELKIGLNKVITCVAQERHIDWLKQLGEDQHRLETGLLKALKIGIGILQKQNISQFAADSEKPRKRSPGSRPVACALDPETFQKFKSLAKGEGKEDSFIPFLIELALRRAYLSKHPQEPELEPPTPRNPLSQIFKHIPEPEASGEDTKKIRLSKFGIPRSKARGNPVSEDEASNPSTDTPQDGAETEGQIIYTAGEIKAFREGHNFSQRKLAEATGISRGIIAEYETGRRKNKNTLIKITKLLMEYSGCCKASTSRT